MIQRSFPQPLIVLFHGYLEFFPFAKAALYNKTSSYFYSYTLIFFDKLTALFTFERVKHSENWLKPLNRPLLTRSFHFQATLHTSFAHPSIYLCLTVYSIVRRYIFLSVPRIRPKLLSPQRLHRVSKCKCSANWATTQKLHLENLEKCPEQMRCIIPAAVQSVPPGSPPRWMCPEYLHGAAQGRCPD